MIIPVPAGCAPPVARTKIRSEDARLYQVGQISSINRVFADLDEMNGGEYIEGSKKKLEFSLWQHYKRRKQTLREIVFKKHIWKVLRDVIEPVSSFFPLIRVGLYFISQFSTLPMHT